MYLRYYLIKILNLLFPMYYKKDTGENSHIKIPLKSFLILRNNIKKSKKFVFKTKVSKIL